MRQIDWYFDFISPYAWFSLHALERLPPALVLRPQPVLFAGLLNHWGQKGPAEVDPKRLWTFRACAWWADTHGIVFHPPARHPFNPLPYLRLAEASGNGLPAIRTIFTRLWTTGVDPMDPATVAALAAELAIDPARLEAPEIKAAIRSRTDRAIAAGVFGVPSWVVDGEVFWGVDHVDFLLAWLRDPGVLHTPTMQRATLVRPGVQRERR